MPVKMLIKRKKQRVPEGKAKVNLFIRETTQNSLNTYAEYLHIRPGALIDLVFADEVMVHELIAKHMAAMPTFLKNHYDK